ncbi:hypothetical protein AX16_005738 [Volvariella volvacea WC 439]|nr:hypothetical protein AX16_005738 [Volvariella volvacea WC 439]
MRPALNSAIFRQSLARKPFAPRGTSVRFSSTSTEGAQKKAQETAEKAWESTKKFLEPAGQTIGRLLGSYKQPLVYNFAVARQVVKQIYVAEGLAPPSLANVRQAYQTLWENASSVAYWRGAISSGEIVRVGIYGLEAYTIFKIGEILGRRHLIGYSIH